MKKLVICLIIAVIIFAGLIALFFFVFKQQSPKTEKETFEYLPANETENSLSSTTTQTVIKTRSSQNPPSTNAEEKSAPPLPSIGTSLPWEIGTLAVYKDSVYGFEINYPENFIPTSTENIIFFYDPATKTFLGFWIDIYESPSITSLDAYIDSEKRVHKNDEFIFGLLFEKIVLNETMAVRKTYYTTAHPETPIIRYTLYHNNIFYSFLVDPPETPTGKLHQEMIAGFRFTK